MTTLRITGFGLDLATRAPREACAAVTKPHVAGLDGLRGIAILMVMCLHAGVPFADAGWLGVDMFFVLSGFLITTLLVSEREANGRIGLLRFWGRRFLRLMPAYWLYVRAISAAMLLSPGPFPLEGWSPGWHIASLFGYFMNYRPATGTSSFAWITLHLWSLCIEEQFYLIWPVICGLALRLRNAWLVPVVIAVTIVIGRIPMDSRYLLSFRLNTRGLSIMLGCLGALAAARMTGSSLYAFVTNRGVRAGAVGAILLTLFCANVASVFHVGADPNFLITKWVTPMFAMEITVLVVCLWYGQKDWIHRTLAWAPLAYTGRISYGLYLYQMLAHFLTWNVLLSGIDHWERHAKYGLRLFVFFALSYGIAALSYRYWEQPFLQLKHRLRSD